VGSCRGFPGRGSELSLLDTVLQVSQCARGAISYVSQQSDNKGPSLSKGKKIKKNKETWILFSTSSTMIKLHFEFGKTAKNKQKDLNTNKI
jgi:hypothetical protein